MTAIAPVSRSKAEARSTYDRRSRSYERVEGRFERRARMSGEELLAVKASERVLEIGSGPGGTLTEFARAVRPHGHVIGLDISPNMARVAATRLHGASLGPRASLVVGDGAGIPIRTGSIDAIFACFTLELFDTPELPVTLEEAHRVLRSDGRLVVVSLTTTEPPAAMERVYLLAHKLMPRLADCRPIPVAALIAEAGFEVGTQRRSDIVGIPVAVVLARKRFTTPHDHDWPSRRAK